MKKKEEVISVLKEKRSNLIQKYHITRIGIFGSVIRDESGAGSDVDICAYSTYVRLFVILTIPFLSEVKTMFPRVDRACGIDVHRLKLTATIIDSLGNAITKEFSTQIQSLIELREWIIEETCERILMEATGINGIQFTRFLKVTSQLLLLIHTS